MPIVTAGSFSIVDVNDGLSATLSKEAFVATADVEGEVIDFSAATTSMKVLVGSVDDTVNWQIDAIPSPEVAGQLTGDTFAVTALNGESGYVDLSASRTGFPTLTRRFSVAKARRGRVGPSLAISASTNTFTFVDGLPSPADQTIALYAQRQGLVGTAVWTISTGDPAETDNGVIVAGLVPFGVYTHGIGDTCYVDLNTIGSADTIYVSCTVEGVSATFAISKSHRSTAQAGATRNVFRGSWSETTAYALGDIVLDRDASWACTVAHISSSGNRPPTQPTTSNANWTLYGAQGRRGTIQAAVATLGTVWSDAEANAAIVAAGGIAPMQNDVVTLYNTEVAFSQTRVFSSTSWEPLAAFFGGNVVVDGTITASKLVVRDATNLLPNGQFDDDEPIATYFGSSPFVSYSTNPTFLKTGIRSLILSRLPGNTADASVVNRFKIPVEEGETIYAETEIRSTSGSTSIGATMRIRFFDINMQAIEGSSVTPETFAGAPLSESWAKYSRRFVVPTGTKFIDIRLILRGSASGNTTVDSVVFDRLILRKANAADLIVDGGLQAAGLSVFGDELKSDNFVAGSTGWRIAKTGEAEFSSLIVRTENLAANASTTVRQGKFLNSGTVYAPSSSYTDMLQYFFTPTGVPDVSFWFNGRVTFLMPTTPASASLDISVVMNLPGLGVGAAMVVFYNRICSVYGVGEMTTTISIADLLQFSNSYNPTSVIIRARSAGASFRLENMTLTMVEFKR